MKERLSINKLHTHTHTHTHTYAHAYSVTYSIKHDTDTELCALIPKHRDIEIH